MLCFPTIILKYQVVQICKDVNRAMKTQVLRFHGSVYIFYTFVYKNFNLPHYLQKNFNNLHFWCFRYAKMWTEPWKRKTQLYFPKLICVFVLCLKRATFANHSHGRNEEVTDLNNVINGGKTQKWYQKYGIEIHNIHLRVLCLCYITDLSEVFDTDSVV